MKLGLCQERQMLLSWLLNIFMPGRDEKMKPNIIYTVYVCMYEAMMYSMNLNDKKHRSVRSPEGMGHLVY